MTASTHNRLIPKSITDAIHFADQVMANRRRIAEALSAREDQLEQARQNLQQAEDRLGEAEASDAIDGTDATANELQDAKRAYDQATDQINSLERAIDALRRRLDTFDAELPASGAEFESKLRQAREDLAGPYVERFRKAVEEMEKARADLVTIGRAVDSGLTTRLKEMTVEDPVTGKNLARHYAFGRGDPTEVSDQAGRLAYELSDAAYTIQRFRGQIRNAESKAREAA